MNILYQNKIGLNKKGLVNECPWDTL